jgi:hypothetical protein
LVSTPVDKAVEIQPLATGAGAAQLPGNTGIPAIWMACVQAGFRTRKIPKNRPYAPCG